MNTNPTDLTIIQKAILFCAHENAQIKWNAKGGFQSPHSNSRFENGIEVIDVTINDLNVFLGWHPGILNPSDFIEDMFTLPGTIRAWYDTDNSCGCTLPVQFLEMIYE